MSLNDVYCPLTHPPTHPLAALHSSPPGAKPMASGSLRAPTSPRWRRQTRWVWQRLGEGAREVDGQWEVGRRIVHTRPHPSTNATHPTPPTNATCQVGSGKTALETLLHEGGHAAHFANIDQHSPFFR